MTPTELAKAAAQAMWDADTASRGLGMSLDSVGVGAATVTMTVTEAMTNGHQTCHGGFIFSLADSAFACACNSYNQRAVAQMCQITFIAPAHLGDRLTATCHEVAAHGRSGIYDSRVTDQNGRLIAEFRGHSRTIKGTHVPTEE
jgi:acyl-CoA thioesterase